MRAQKRVFESAWELTRALESLRQHTRVAKSAWELTRALENLRKHTRVDEGARETRRAFLKPTEDVSGLKSYFMSRLFANRDSIFVRFES